LNKGDVIVVNGSAARDETNLASAKTVKLPDGTHVFKWDRPETLSFSSGLES
jgi:hypothetical protein